MSTRGDSNTDRLTRSLKICWSHGSLVVPFESSLSSDPEPLHQELNLQAQDAIQPVPTIETANDDDDERLELEQVWESMPTTSISFESSMSSDPAPQHQELSLQAQDAIQPVPTIEPANDDDDERLELEQAWESLPTINISNSSPSEPSSIVEESHARPGLGIPHPRRRYLSENDAYAQNTHRRLRHKSESEALTRYDIVTSGSFVSPF